MLFNLSVVNIISDLHREAINQIAELYGCGPGNISVKLQDDAGSIYWGCHSFWNPDHYAIFTDTTLRAQIVPAELLPSLEFLYERLSLNGNAQENWQAALNEIGLSIIEAEM